MRIVAAEVELGRPLQSIGVVVSRGRAVRAAARRGALRPPRSRCTGPPCTLAQSVTGRTLLGALALADDDFGRASVIRLDERAPLRANGERLRPAGWARSALRAGVVRGPEQWTDRLGQSGDRARRRAAARRVRRMARCRVWGRRARVVGGVGRLGPHVHEQGARVAGGAPAMARGRALRVRRGRAGGRRPPVPRRDRARADQPRTRPRTISGRCWRCLRGVGVRSATECSAGRCAMSWASTST